MVGPQHSALLCNESVRTGGGTPKGGNQRRGGPHGLRGSG